jgi:NitT/TauT family transport system ATP-binding protein
MLPLPIDGPLEALDLGAWYPPRLDVFRGVTFRVEPGTCLGVIGPNACGKSTLLETLAGILPPHSGSVRRADRLTYVPQNYRQSFVRWASLEASLLFTCPRPFADRVAHRRSLSAIAEELGIGVDLGRRPAACSGGTLQQAALLRALWRPAPIVLMDEPFSALDVEVSRRLRPSIRRMMRERRACAVLVLHNPDEILELCDQVLIVPGRPFSTATLAGFDRAELHNLSTCVLPRAEAAGAAPFLTAVRGQLGLG